MLEENSDQKSYHLQRDMRLSGNTWAKTRTTLDVVLKTAPHCWLLKEVPKNTLTYIFPYLSLTQFLKGFPLLSTFTPACFKNSRGSLSRRQGYVCINFLAKYSHIRGVGLFTTARTQVATVLTTEFLTLLSTSPDSKARSTFRPKCCGILKELGNQSGIGIPWSSLPWGGFSCCDTWGTASSSLNSDMSVSTEMVDLEDSAELMLEVPGDVRALQCCWGKNNTDSPTFHVKRLWCLS